MMRFDLKRLGKHILTALLLVFLCAGVSPVFGQATSTGTVVGTVTDQSGAVIAGVVITLTDLATNDGPHREDDRRSGQYVVVNLPPADYRITATKDGFSVAEVASEAVTVGSQSNANFKLAVGAVNETVEVTETASDLQTLNATIGATVTEPNSSTTCPRLGHDVSTFLTLQPGVSPEGSVAGTVTDQASFSLDGGNNSSDMDGSMPATRGRSLVIPLAVSAAAGYAGPSGVMPTPADSVEEFKSNTANQTADFNNSSGAQIEVVTKRGTDKWHGTAYDYYFDYKANANSWGNNLTGTPIA